MCALVQVNKQSEREIRDTAGLFWEMLCYSIDTSDTRLATDPFLLLSLLVAEKKKKILKFICDLVSVVCYNKKYVT